MAMPHIRQRSILDPLIKRLKFTPVVAIQGARQTGKSFLARELLKTKIKNSVYVSLDDKSKQQLAQDSPQTFLATLEGAAPAIIDEAQKSPALFDAIKLQVDRKRIPGAYLLLGSTEFSLLQNIRESLTGRIGRIRIYPMTFLELQGEKGKKTTRAQFLKYLDSGGMPGIAFVRDLQARSDFFQDWIDLTCQRDLHQFKKLKLDTQLAYEILRQTSILEEPTAAQLAKFTRANPKKIATHLKALCELFALTRLDPHPSGTGKPIYLPLDAGIAGHLGALPLRRLQIILANERMAKNSYEGGKRHSFYYYRSTGKKMIHLVEQKLDGSMNAFQLFEREAIKKPDLELFNAFNAKNQGAKLFLLAPILEGWSNGNKSEAIQIKPWESMLNLA